jgi:hypothetical protein
MTDNVSFDEHHTQFRSYSEPKGMVGFLIKKCGVQDESVANIILVVFAIIIFVIAGFVFYSALH